MSEDFYFAQLSKIDFQVILKEALDENDYHIPTPYELHKLESLYWDSTNLSKFITNTFTDPNFLIHFNIQNLSAKFDALNTFLSLLINDINKTCIPRIIALSETLLTEHNKHCFPIINYHPIVCKNRPDNSARGGVAIYIRDDCEFDERPDLNVFIPQVFESVFVTLHHLDITIGVIYRSPLADTSAFLRYFNDVINSLKKSNSKFILLGDFNIDLLKYKQILTSPNL